MSWIPFFSNCDSSDERIIVYDFFEYDSSCTLPQDIGVVNPIPSTGLNPTADTCDFNFVCRFDEPLTQDNNNMQRWYQISEEMAMFYITRDPQTVEQFFSKDEGSEKETAFL